MTERSKNSKNPESFQPFDLFSHFLRLHSKNEVNSEKDREKIRIPMVNIRGFVELEVYLHR